MVYQVLQGRHADIVAMEIDLSELGVLVQGWQVDIKLGVLHIIILLLQGLQSGYDSF